MTVAQDPHWDRSFVALVDAICVRQPARPAMFHGGQTFSYGELAALVEDWAAALRDRGVGPDRCVALWLPNSPAFVAAFLATLRLGAVAAPLGVLLTGHEVEQRMAIARANVLVTTRALEGQVGHLAASVPAIDSAGPGRTGGSAGRGDAPSRRWIRSGPRSSRGSRPR